MLTKNEVRIIRHGATLAERFWAHVEKRKSGCWEWVGRTREEYGIMQVRKDEHPSHTSRSHGAHRISWFLHTGKWPTKSILHTCDNSPCVRPAHLYEGTHLDNMRDCIERGRRPKGEQSHNAVLTIKKVRFIRRSRLTNKALAKKFRVSETTIQRARTGRDWNHVKNPPPVSARRYEKWNA